MKMKKKIVSLLLCCMVFMYGCGNNEAGYNWDGTFVGAIIKDGKTSYMGYTTKTSYKTVIDDVEVVKDNKSSPTGTVSYTVVANKNRTYSDLAKVKAVEIYIFNQSDDKLKSVMIGLTSDEMGLEEFNDYIANYLDEKFSGIECDKGSSKTSKKEDGISIRDDWTFTTKDGKTISVEFGSEIDVVISL